MTTSEQPTFRTESPSPTASPRPAKNPNNEIRRFASSSSTGSDFSPRSSAMSYDSTTTSSDLSVTSSSKRESSMSSASRSSSANFGTRRSMIMDSDGKPIRRGYVRPQGTNFAASAQSRESVLSLGSIAHLQYYFARTGLLDGKGGQLAKDKKDKTRHTIDFSQLDSNFLAPRRSLSCTDKDSSYSSMRSSPDFMQGEMVESPTEDYFSDGDEDMLPPTVSTYRKRTKTIEPPPSLPQLKRELNSALDDADKVLADAKAVKTDEAAGVKLEDNPILLSTPKKAPRSPNQLVHTPDPPLSPLSPGANPQGWYELQGMHILDIITLAIRAARIYYTAHDKPARLAIKSERQLRAELLGVMDVLKRMATRNFEGGMKDEEREVMEDWVKGVRELLRHEEMEDEKERETVAGWTWLNDSLWINKEIDREYEFLRSMDPDPIPLPPYTHPASSLPPSQLPTPFLKELQNGLRLVKLHNALVKISKRPFGAIPVEKFHEDTGKPYRMADNLRYWIKAAELRWDVVFEPRVDVMGVVNGDENCWVVFEKAVWRWCKKVREELGEDLRRG